MVFLKVFLILWVEKRILILIKFKNIYIQPYPHRVGQILPGKGKLIMLILVENLVENQVKRIYLEEKGQGMVEYALILTLVALAAISGVTILGQEVTNFFQGLMQLEIFTTLPFSLVG